MNVASRTRLPGTLWTGLAILLAAATASGQYRDEYGQYRNDFGDVRQTVARISYVAGDASFARGDDPDNWQPADRNIPMTLGDRVYTGNRSRMELQVQGGDYIRLGAGTDFAALNLTDDAKQFSINAGVASFQIRRLFEEENFEVDTPNAAVTFETPGDYRMDVDSKGNTRVLVRRGRCSVAAGGGQVALQSGDEMDIDGIDSPRYDVFDVSALDGWDRWVSDRESRGIRARSYSYVSAEVVGADDLDDSGRWENVPEYGRCWTPTAVAADWAPYRFGHWIWQDPWGWTWVSAEPWGWAPYHYGRWVVYSSRWYWVPVGPRVRFVTYSPALVAFVGSGGGFSASFRVGDFSISTGRGFVGWFPLGPRDPLVPWWQSRPGTSVSITNATYVNRTYVTVVNQNTFVSGGAVSTGIVRDRTVVNQIASAPVVRGAVPVVPTRGALQMAVRQDLPAPPRPPAQIVSRAVVARVAPPPAPPTFQSKVTVIQENKGAPVAPEAAARMSVETHGRARAITEVHPVAPDPGHVTLAPRGREATKAEAAHPEPVAPLRGRPMATTNQPVSTSPVTSSGPPVRERVERQVPQAPQAPPTAVAPEERLRGRPERVAPPTAPPPEATQPPPQERLRGRPERFVPPTAPPPEATQPPPQERLRGRPERFVPPTAPPPPEATQPPPQERLRGRPEGFVPPTAPPPPEATQPPPQERLRGRPERVAPQPPPPPPPEATQPPPPPSERLRGRPERPAPPTEKPAEGKGEERRLRGRQPEPTPTKKPD